MSTTPVRWLQMIAALILVPDAATIICQTDWPVDAKARWAYRIIDERTCWYEGQPGMSKSRLKWKDTDWGPKPNVIDDLKDEPPAAGRSRAGDDLPNFDRRWEDAVRDLKLWRPYQSR